MDELRCERFWSKVQIGDSDDCWPYLGYLNPDGYGRFGEILAHRLAYQLAKGEIPKHLVIMHTCDNPCCCNPEHLLLGTQADNNADRALKQRNRNQQGEKGPRALISDHMVPQIYKLYLETHSYKKVAQAFGVGSYSIRNIVRGDSWKHMYYLFQKMKEDYDEKE